MCVYLWIYKQDKLYYANECTLKIVLVRIVTVEKGWVLCLILYSNYESDRT